MLLLSFLCFSFNSVALGVLYVVSPLISFVVLFFQPIDQLINSIYLLTIIKKYSVAGVVGQLSFFLALLLCLFGVPYLVSPMVLHVFVVFVDVDFDLWWWWCHTFLSLCQFYS